MSIRTETMTMRYTRINSFTFDLTWEQKQLCTWVAERASSGVRRIYYGELKTVLGIASDQDITRLLKDIRERIDDVHEMVSFPIVNTASPYFDVHARADYIWADYCRAEREIVGTRFDGRPDETDTEHHLEHGCAACAV